MADTEKNTPSTIMPTMRYKDAPAAIDWLCQVFGFARHAVYANPDGTISHAELTLDGGMIMLGSQKDDEYGRGFKSPQELGGVETRSSYIVVADADAGVCAGAGHGRDDCAAAQEHRIWQPRVQREGSRRTFVERGNIQSLDRARLGTAHA